MTKLEGSLHAVPSLAGITAASERLQCIKQPSLREELKRKEKQTGFVLSLPHIWKYGYIECG
jgi:hypothetical protein